MNAKQNRLCAICGNPETRIIRGKSILSVDHNHKTGKVRALLCNNCNQGIGKLKDNIDILKLAIEYLEKHND